jgi:hypothetical protein
VVQGLREQQEARRRSTGVMVKKRGNSSSDNKPKATSTYHQVGDDQIDNPVKKSQLQHCCKKTVGEKMAMAVRLRWFCVFMASHSWSYPVSICCYLLLKRCNRNPPISRSISFWCACTGRKYNGRLRLRRSQKQALRTCVRPCET